MLFWHWKLLDWSSGLALLADQGCNLVQTQCCKYCHRNQGCIQFLRSQNYIPDPRNPHCTLALKNHCWIPGLKMESCIHTLNCIHHWFQGWNLALQQYWVDSLFLQRQRRKWGLWCWYTWSGSCWSLSFHTTTEAWSWVRAFRAFLRWEYQEVGWTTGK